MLLPNLMTDLRYAARRLAASLGFTAAAVVTIALGVGINTGLFSVLNGIALRDLPAPDAGELVSIHQTWGRGFVAAGETTVTLGGEVPQEITGALVSCNCFEVLRHPTALGRRFANDCDADGAVPTAVLSHDLWMTAFGGDAGIVGREVQLNRQAFVVVGIAPNGMRGLDIVPVQFFAPLSAQPILDPQPLLPSGGSLRSLVLLGRLADGASGRSAPSSAC